LVEHPWPGVAGVVRYAPGMAPEQRHAEIHMRHDAKPDTQTHSALLQAGPNDEVDHHRAYDRQRHDAQKQPSDASVISAQVGQKLETRGRPEAGSK
jgi:hypothetical protein